MKKKLFWLFFVIAIVFSALSLTACADAASPEVSTYAYNLIFGNQVYMEYAVKVDGAAEVSLSDVGVLIWRESETNRTPANAVADLKAARTVSIEGVDCYVSVYTDINAKEMTDKIFSQPYVKYNGQTHYGEIVEYSICTYAERKLGLVEGVQGTTNETLRSMIRDMLHYGANAQKYFGYKTDTLATDILEGRVNIIYENMEGFSNPNPATLEYASGKYILQKPEKNGYTFKGWKDIDNEWTDLTEIDASAPRTYHLHAVWERNQYTITYQGTMGMNNENPANYTVEDFVQLRPLQKYDYNFKGWRITNENGEWEAIEEIPHGTTGNLVLIAEWEQKPEFQGLSYVVDDNYLLPDGRKFCIFLGVNSNDITKLEISSVFTHIQAGALSNCSQLKELTLPFLGSDYTCAAGSYLGYVFGAETALGQNSCIPQSLQKVTVNGSGKIGINAFRDCTSLVEIVVSSTTWDIGQNAYLGCTSLVSLTTPMYINEAMRYSGTKYPRYLTDFYYGIPGSFDRVNHGGLSYIEKYLEIPRYSFETLHINGGVIGSHAFENNLGIKHLIIEGVEIIRDSAFRNAENLETLTLHEGLKQIQDNAFFSCGNKKFNEVIIPNSVTKLGGNDGGVASLNYNGTSYSGPAETPGYREGAFGGCCYLSKIVIGDGVEVIPYGCFDRSTNQPLDYEDLELTLGKNVRVIGPLAFYLPAGRGFSRIINHSQHKEMLIYAQGSSDRDDTKILLRALAECENRPEKIYLGYDYDNYLNLNALSGCNITEEELLALGFTFALFTQTNPYENGTANDNFTYWNIGDPWFWITKQYDTPVLWEKPSEAGA